MPRRVLLESGRDQFFVVEEPAQSEKSLQDVMRSNPKLIPSEDLGFEGELLVIGRETVLASGLVDLLCLTRSGDIVVIEFKTGPKNPDFRHALAQVMDYGSDLWQMSVEDFDRAVVQRHLAGPYCDPQFKAASNLGEAIALAGWDLSDNERAAMESRLGDVLSSGDFTYVIGAQRFTDSMRKTVAYLNAMVRQGRFFLLEVIRLGAPNLTAHAAQVVAAPQPADLGPKTGALSQASENSFLEAISDDDYRETMHDILATCSALGLIIAWGSKGASIRLRTPDRAEPLSIGWIFLPGDQWYGARHLTLGVDEATLRSTPTVEPAIRKFVAAVGAIPGAQTLKSALNAYMFEPRVVPSAKSAIITSMTALVQATAQ